MGDEKISFKVFLKYKKKQESRSDKERKRKGKKENVRRFLLDKDSLDLAGLKQKISKLYPELFEEDYVLSWTDAEKDNVVIQNDEDLAIAMMDMSGPIFTICINVKNQKMEQKISIKDAKTPKSRRKTRRGLQNVFTGKNKGKNGKGKKKEERNGHHKKGKYLNYTINCPESSPLALVEELLLNGGSGARFLNQRGITIEMKVEINVNKKSATPRHCRKKISSSSSSSSSRSRSSSISSSSSSSSS